MLLNAQTTLSDSLPSNILKETRHIRVHLPKTFATNEGKTYPLILALDGEYMFYSVVGNTELLTTNGKIPEVIVVGIDQNYVDATGNYARWNDCSYNSGTGFVQNKGKDFKKFIELELLPFLEHEYRVGQSKTICGHSLTANYINYFLLDKTHQFNAYISISPYVPEALFDSLYHSLNNCQENIFYYLSTGENDLSGHKKNIQSIHTTVFSRIDNGNFRLMYDEFKNETHYSLVSRSLPIALKAAFRIYAPIDDAEYEQILNEQHPLDYLQKKYQSIKEIYGIDLKFREDDLNNIAWIAIEIEDWKALKNISDSTIHLYPESVYGYYNLALVYEKESNYEKALELYEQGYSKLGEDVLNKDDFYKDIRRMKIQLNKK